MAWSMGGGFNGGAFGGGNNSARNAGLPFAGIPSELRAGVEKIVADEPAFADEHVDFSHVDYDRRRLTLRRFLAPHKWALVGGSFLVLFETAAMQAGPVLTQIGIDSGIREGNIGVVVAVSIAYFLAVGINVIASGLRVAQTGRVGQNLMFHLRVRIFSHFQRLSVDFFTKSKAGILMTRMTSDLESLTQLFQEGLVQMVVQGLTMLFVAGILFYYNATLALITLFAIVPALLAVTIWFRRASDRGYDMVRDRIGELLSHLQESLSGIRIIAAYNRQRHNIVEHRNVAARYRDANDYTATVGAIYGPSAEVIGLCGQALVLLIGGNMVLDGRLTLGELSAFVLSLNTFFAPIQQLVQLYDTFQKGQASLRKLGDLLSTEPTVGEKPEAIDIPPLVGEIRLEGVSFGYVTDRPVLRDVDLVIQKGETFSLVGETGAGKSTIAKLVTRFHDPTAGRVLIDGHDLRDVTLTSLRRQLGIVPQEPFLFSGSIRDNIAFARPDATDDEVLEACRAVGIDDLVDRLPDGIHTPCHERGVSLSSGERQLLALARAFLSQPRVLVLDEATSNLDLRSESKIEHALDVLLEGRTAIIIAHRLQTAMRADRIAVVHDGEIVELGSHDELVARTGGRYAEMYATWEAHASGERVPSAG
ncbi:MAG: ABC transporter ATP-binding protein/permease [Actinomycetota bacterium]|nr:ABC transporter ATP-binding protein/permease [Actinomycetota bacterium]